MEKSGEHERTRRHLGTRGSVCQSQLYVNDDTHGRGIKGQKEHHGESHLGLNDTRKEMIGLESMQNECRMPPVGVTRKKRQSKWFYEMTRLPSDVQFHTTS